MSDELYGLPLSEFIAARDALSAKLKAAGDKPGAAEVKKLAKPSVPAWAANQIVRWGRRDFERLRTAAQALREQQATGAPAQALREAVREQSQALQACEQRAGQLLADSGHAATPAVLQRVSHTLLALAYGTGDARAGCLSAELLPPGFDALPVLAPAQSAPEPAQSAPAAPQPPVGADTHEQLERQRAEARRQRLQQAVDTAHESVAAAEVRLRAHEAHAADAERRLQAARQQAALARQEASHARARLAALDQELRTRV